MNQYKGLEAITHQLENRAANLVAELELSTAQLREAASLVAKRELSLRKWLATNVSRLGSLRNRKIRRAILRSGLFDVGYYLLSCRELLTSREHPLDHYLRIGADQGLNPHPLFDGRWYLERYPDVAAQHANPLVHFVRFGASERRCPHPLFDSDIYVALYPDVAASGQNPLSHYVKHGGGEGRRPHWLFDAAAYLEAYPEVLELSISPLEHYVLYGSILRYRPHRYFDPVFYLLNNPEVVHDGVSPLCHFVAYGGRAGRDPSEEFSVEAYWREYPDVRASGENPLVHFASQADYRLVYHGIADDDTPLPPTLHVAGSEVSKGALTPPPDAEPPTQKMSDFLYDEFGLAERSRIVSGMQQFRLPLNPELGFPEPADDDLESLAERVSELAASHPMQNSPDVSIVIPVYNQVRFTLACLYSLLSSESRYTFEIIVADDCSSDATPAFFSQGITNVHHVRSMTNVGFLRNCNNAAKHARGRIVIFLNNDTYVLPGWLDHLVETLDKNPDVGLVGSKLIFADGRLQESGGLIFADGSGWNYGRFDDPRKPEYCCLRDSDYVSGASIALSTELWKTLGGFDERYEMAYYEDTDLAFQVREAGKRVVVQPASQLIHFEGVTSGTDLTTGAKRYQVVNGEIFRQRWAGALSSHGSADPDNLPTHRDSRGNILVIDALTPTPDRDSGSMDTYQYLRILRSFGFRVFFAPENLTHAGNYTTELQQIGVEACYAPHVMSFDDLLKRIGPQLDYVFLYRAPVAANLYDKVRQLAPSARVIFDTVDLHFLRLEREAELAADKAQATAAQRMREIELDLIGKADATIVLSRFEMELLKDLTPKAKLFEIPIVREVPPPSETSFEQRRDIVFVGGFDHTPNVDAVKWFVNEVVPHLKAKGFTDNFVIVGSNMPEEIRALAEPGIVPRGFVADLEEFFSEIRLSLAPLRYGAGLKGKVISSLSYGVPVVATSVAVEGGGFQHGEQVIVADEPEAFADAIIRTYSDAAQWQNLSQNGYQFFESNFSVGAVAKKLDHLLADCIQ